MATYQSLHNITLVAGADLSASQYRFMTVAADGQIDPTGDGANAHGVLQNKPSAAGEAATVAIAGVSKVVAGAAVAAGASVASDANGGAVPPTVGEEKLGTALEAAGAAGEIIEVLLQLGPGQPN
ncbi:capsid cement protein [Pelagibius sp.]|uniref:capsid cement protein n=1 Tax=Pelagibius sp. TaxID=1931238 RepID=UPI00261B0EA5|nr:capsid cement protein [Pelagibius sp.]